MLYGNRYSSQIKRYAEISSHVHWTSVIYVSHTVYITQCGTLISVHMKSADLQMYVSVKGSHHLGLIQWLLTLQYHLLLDPLENEGEVPRWRHYGATVGGGEVSTKWNIRCHVWKLFPVYTLLPCDLRHQSQAYSTDVWIGRWDSYVQHSCVNIWCGHKEVAM